MRRLAIVFLLLCYCQAALADSGCSGRFLNPISDVCWSCLFPLTVGDLKLVDNKVADTKNPKSPVCACANGGTPRVGLAVGFFEPARLVDVTRHPFCFVNFGGHVVDMGGSVNTGMVTSGASSEAVSTYQVHWYVYPLLALLNLVSDALCVENSGFDLAYLSEFDITWNDDEAAFLLNPESALFTSVAAAAACAGDCAMATVGLGSDPLFWCAGCQGAMYPLSGHVQAHIGGVQASTLIAERVTYKLHRLGLLWGSIGSEALCALYPMPIMKKSQYRLQMVYPKPATQTNVACNPYGRSTSIWEAGREYPITGEDFGYLVWRKRNCCAF